MGIAIIIIFGLILFIGVYLDEDPIQEIEEEFKEQYRIKQVITDGKSEWMPQRKISKGGGWNYLVCDRGLNPSGYETKIKALKYIKEMGYKPKIKEKIHYL